MKDQDEQYFPLDKVKQETAYRQGVYDAYVALQNELR